MAHPEQGARLRLDLVGGEDPPPRLDVVPAEPAVEAVVDADVGVVEGSEEADRAAVHRLGHPGGGARSRATANARIGIARARRGPDLGPRGPPGQDRFGRTRSTLGSCHPGLTSVF